LLVVGVPGTGSDQRTPQGDARVLAVAARFSTHWELSLLNDAICGATRERKVECVEVLNFELRRDQLPGAPSP